MPYPFRDGSLPVGVRTPTANLDLQPGEWVRVKSLSEITATCDKSKKNRGMTPLIRTWCPIVGKTFQILKRVTRILNEKTGKLEHMKNPCIILDSVVCQARYCDNRLFCPREVYSFWREIWLERVEPKLPVKVIQTSFSEPFPIHMKAGEHDNH